MKAILKSSLILCALLAAPMTAHAQDAVTEPATGQAFRVDDSGTVVLDPVLQMQSQTTGRAIPGSPLVSGSTRVSVQLNLLAWTGKTGRIFMTLPRSSGPTVRATWQTGGTLLPGSLISGDRSVVYAGPITAPLMRDLIDIKLEADGARLIQPEALAFGFEIEIDQ